jgi:hypothetical protein
VRPTAHEQLLFRLLLSRSYWDCSQASPYKHSSKRWCGIDSRGSTPVEVIAGHLQEARIWEKDEVRCEKWFDPKLGTAALLSDLLVAEGKVIRKWSNEKHEYVYRISEVQAVSRMSV